MSDRPEPIVAQPPGKTGPAALVLLLDGHAAPYHF